MKTQARTVLALLLAAVFCLAGVAKAQEVVIQIGYENHPGEPLDLGCNEWKRLVEEESGGAMTIELYPSSQLGSKNDIIDQMLAGDSVVTLADGAFYADRGVPDFSILFAPYLFTSWDDCWKLVASPWYAEQSKKLEEKGLKLLPSNWVYGDRHTLTTRPVRSVADLKGMKIRVPNNRSPASRCSAPPPRPSPWATSTPPSSRASSTGWRIPSPSSTTANSRKWRNTSPLTAT